MERLVEDLKKATSWKGLKRMFSVFKVASGAARLANPMVGGVSGCVAELGNFVAERAIEKRSDDALGAPAASLVLDAGERLHQR